MLKISIDKSVDFTIHNGVNVAVLVAFPSGGRGTACGG